MARVMGNALAVLAVSFGAGAVPFAQIAARRTRGVDLRHWPGRRRSRGTTGHLCLRARAGAGGRGISPALGALTVTAPAWAGVLAPIVLKRLTGNRLRVLLRQRLPVRLELTTTFGSALIVHAGTGVTGLTWHWQRPNDSGH